MGTIIIARTENEKKKMIENEKDHENVSYQESENEHAIETRMKSRRKSK